MLRDVDFHIVSFHSSKGREWCVRHEKFGQKCLVGVPMSNGR